MSSTDLSPATVQVDAPVEVVKKAKSKAISRSVLANTISPVGRVKARMKKFHARVSCPRVSDLAAVSQAALMDYLASDILTVAGESVQDAGRSRITPADIAKTFREDMELNPLAPHNSIIPRGGVRQFIDPMLLRRAKKNKKKRSSSDADAKPSKSAKSKSLKKSSKKSASKKSGKSASKKYGAKKSASKKAGKSTSKKSGTKKAANKKN
jgi:histone H3/H4